MAPKQEVLIFRLLTGILPELATCSELCQSWLRCSPRRGALLWVVQPLSVADHCWHSWLGYSLQL